MISASAPVQCLPRSDHTSIFVLSLPFLDQVTLAHAACVCKGWNENVVLQQMGILGTVAVRYQLPSSLGIYHVGNQTWRLVGICVGRVWGDI